MGWEVGAQSAPKPPEAEGGLSSPPTGAMSKAIAAEGMPQPPTGKGGMAAEKPAPYVWAQVWRSGLVSCGQLDGELFNLRREEGE